VEKNNTTHILHSKIIIRVCKKVGRGKREKGTWEYGGKGRGISGEGKGVEGDEGEWEVGVGKA